MNSYLSDNINNSWLIFGRNINKDVIDRLAQQQASPLACLTVDNYQALVMQVPINPQLMAFCQQRQLDFAMLDNVPDLSQPGLVLFDMDSTAISIECIDEIGKLAGISDQIARITEQAMQGRLDFSQSLYARVAMLQGVPIELLARIHLPLSSGMRHLCQRLKQRGWYLAVASGGFTFFSDQLAAMLPLDYSEANTLAVAEQKLSGELVGPIVDAKRKAVILQSLANKFALPVSQTIAVGDGANDLAMMAAAGLSVAYRAKAAVKKQAQIGLTYSNLAGILCILEARLFLRNLHV